MTGPAHMLLDSKFSNRRRGFAVSVNCDKPLHSGIRVPGS